MAKQPPARPETPSPDKPAASPLTHPVTTLLIADIVLRGSAVLARRFVEHRLLKNKYGGETAEEVLASQPKAVAATAILLSRVATNSTPGALLVGGGILAKSLFDRAGAYRRERAGRAKSAQDERIP